MIENIAERFTQMDDVDKSILPDIWQENRRNVRNGSSRERQRLQQREDDLCLIRRGDLRGIHLKNEYAEQ